MSSPAFCGPSTLGHEVRRQWQHCDGDGLVSEQRDESHTNVVTDRFVSKNRFVQAVWNNAELVYCAVLISMTRPGPHRSSPISQLS